jgi:hypothetical protein
MRFDGAEIKVTLGGEQTDSAVDELGLPSGVEPWEIYFCEDVTPGLSRRTPLLDRNVVLRARDKPGGKDDTTVKAPSLPAFSTHRCGSAEQDAPGPREAGGTSLEPYGGHTPTRIQVRVLQRVLALTPPSGTTTTSAPRPQNFRAPTTTDPRTRSSIGIQGAERIRL